MATWDVAISINTVVYDEAGTPSTLNDDASFRFDLFTDELGRLGRVTSKLKLSQHIVRSLVNRRNTTFLTRFNASEAEAIVRSSLNDLRSVQQGFIRQNDVQTRGWDIFKKSRKTGQYERLNNIPVSRVFTDGDVVPSRREIYQIGRRSRRSPDRTSVVETLEITPPQSGSKFDFDHENVIVLPTRDSVSFYFRSNRTFSEGELIQSIGDIAIVQSSDPRHVTIRVQLTTVAGEELQLTLPMPIRYGLAFL